MSIRRTNFFLFLKLLRTISKRKVNNIKYGRFYDHNCIVCNCIKLHTCITFFLIGKCFII